MEPASSGLGVPRPNHSATQMTLFFFFNNASSLYSITYSHRLSGINIEQSIESQQFVL